MSLAYRNRKKAIARGEPVWVTQNAQVRSWANYVKLTRKYRNWRWKFLT